jgi:hypothetical protein
VVHRTCVDIAAANGAHIGLLQSTNQLVLCDQLRDIVDKHRAKPRIYQFNSIDVDGVEVDVA